MAKKKVAAVVGRLAGLKVALVGKFGYADVLYSRRIVAEGGVVVDPAKSAPDCIFVGAGRGGKPPGDVAKLQKKHPAAAALQEGAFLKLLVPDRERLLHEIAQTPKSPKIREFWDDLKEVCEKSREKIDLRNTDLRGADLQSAHLECTDLQGSDLRQAKVGSATFGELQDVNLDECRGDVKLQSATRCTFRGVRGIEFRGWSSDLRDCDLTDAAMRGGHAFRSSWTDCRMTRFDFTQAILKYAVFARCDLSEANLARVEAEQARFEECRLERAVFHRAFLHRASLVGANLRQADLRAAILSGADLTGADVTGADLQDVVLTGAKLEGVNLTKARNYTPPVVRSAGPRLAEFARAVARAKDFSTSADLSRGGKEVGVSVGTHSGKCVARSAYRVEEDNAKEELPATTLEQGLLLLAERWPQASLLLDSIEVDGGPPGVDVETLAVAAWAETFGISASPAEELQKQQAQALKDREKLAAKIRSKGLKVWDDLEYAHQKRIDLRGIDLSGARLDGLWMNFREMQGANFAGSSLKGAHFIESKLQNAVFTGADLEGANLEKALLNGANLRDADLSKADLTGARLQGADLTGAVLKGTKLKRAQFDQATIFPARYKPPAEMAWKGKGARKAVKVQAKPTGSLDFDTFLAQLKKKVEKPRLDKAAQMLKAERFQLFAEVTDAALAGAVKSQSSKDLVYSCRLAADGSYGCCTQNLRPCGGLRGALCKHLLVLIVGLAKAGRLDAATVAHWIELSRPQAPKIEEESMSQTFLRLQGAEAGEIDWRPTETIPEDFYAM